MHKGTRSQASAQRKRRAVIAAVAAAAVAGCSGNLVTGPVTDAQAPFAATESAPARTAAADAAPAREEPLTGAISRPLSLAELARANAANPRDPIVVRAYVRALKANGKRNEAL